MKRGNNIPKESHLTYMAMYVGAAASSRELVLAR